MLAASVGTVLLRELDAVSRSVEAYPDDESLWKSVPGISNSGGTLVLHIAGNLRHFLGNVLGGVGYTRDRDAEFAKRGMTRDELVAELGETKKAVESGLTALSDDLLSRPYPTPIGGRVVGTGDFVVHLATHLAYHLGQLDYHRRIVAENATAVPALEVSALPEAGL